MYLWGVVCVFRGGYMYACGVFLRVVGVFVCVLCICVWFCLCGLCICAVCVLCVCLFLRYSTAVLYSICRRLVVIILTGWLWRFLS